MDNPLVSIVIIFLNAESFLEDAVQSVFNQTVKNWELLLVDDGSTDASTIIAQRYAQGSSGRVRYLQHPNHANLGMSASRNLGARNGSGEFIAFLDADDAWLPENLEKQLDIMQRFPEVAMNYCYLTWWYSWTGQAEDRDRDFIEIKRGVIPNEVILPPKLAILFLKRQATASPCVLVRRSAFEKVEGFDESFPCVYEDQVFCTKIALNYPIYVSSESWYRWRQHQEAHHVLEHQQFHDRWFSYLVWFKKYVESNKIKSPQLILTMWSALIKLRYPFFFNSAARVLQFIKKIASLPSRAN